MNFLNAGIPVTMLETKQEALDRGVATIRKNYEAQVKKGKLTQEKYEQRMGLLTTTLSYDDLKNADLIIEAVFEEMGVKEPVFKQLDEVPSPARSWPPTPPRWTWTRSPPSPSVRRTWWACTSSARPT
jgi:3-hydroxyacyl-CoA dehydrogenase